MDYDFEITSISNEKPSILTENLGFRSNKARFLAKYLVYFKKGVKSQVFSGLYVYRLASVSVVTCAYVDY